MIFGLIFGVIYTLFCFGPNPVFKKCGPFHGGKFVWNNVQIHHWTFWGPVAFFGSYLSYDLATFATVLMAQGLSAPDRCQFRNKVEATPVIGEIDETDKLNAHNMELIDMHEPQEAAIPI